MSERAEPMIECVRGLVSFRLPLDRFVAVEEDWPNANLGPDRSIVQYRTPKGDVYQHVPFSASLIRAAAKATAVRHGIEPTPPVPRITLKGSDGVNLSIERDQFRYLLPAGGGTLVVYRMFSQECRSVVAIPYDDAVAVVNRAFGGKGVIPTAAPPARPGRFVQVSPNLWVDPSHVDSVRYMPSVLATELTLASGYTHSVDRPAEDVVAELERALAERAG